MLIAPVAWKASTTLSGFNRWTGGVGLVAATLLLAAPTTESGSVVVHFNGRFFVEVALLGGLVMWVTKHVTCTELATWLGNVALVTDFPAVLTGVFLRRDDPRDHAG